MYNKLFKAPPGIKHPAPVDHQWDVCTQVPRAALEILSFDVISKASKLSFISLRWEEQKGCWSLKAAHCKTLCLSYQGVEDPCGAWNGSHKHHSCSSLPHGQEGRHSQPAPLLTVKGRTGFSRLFPSCTSPQPPVLPDTNQKTLSEAFQLQR